MNERFICEAVEQSRCAVRPKLGWGGARLGAGRKKSLSPRPKSALPDRPPKPSYSKICAHCARPFDTLGARQNFCAERCSRAARHRRLGIGVPRELNCVTCGSAFFNKMSHAKYCGTACQPKKIHQFVCAKCGKDFERPWSKALFCSKGCLYAHTSELLKARAAASRNSCNTCGKPTRLKRQFYCDKKCYGDSVRKTPEEKAIAKRLWKKANYKKPVPKQRRCLDCSAPITDRRRCNKCLEQHSVIKPALRDQDIRRNCKRCSTEFSTLAAVGKRRGRRLFCSAECGDLYHHEDVGKNHRQRTRHFGGEYEPVRALSVLERDGYRCMICGIKTPKRLRGSTAPNAPELDHRVPLAMGGGHTWANLQCACRKCNIRKGGKKVEGQLVLFAA